VFLLIPHIVRESVLSRLNTRAIDTGTSQSIELHRESAAAVSTDPTDAEAGPSPIQPTVAPVTAANAAAAMVHPTPQQLPGNLPAVSAPVQAGGGVTVPFAGGAAAAAVGGVQFTVQTANQSPAVGSTFQVAVQISNAVDVFAVPLQVQFNPAVLQLVNVDTGAFLGSDGQAVAMAHRDEGNGLVAMSARRPPNSKGVNGSGSVATNLPAIGSSALVHVK
jgi:general secretion pathway protein D